MTRKMDFTKKMSELIIQLEKNDYEGMYDVDLMEELGFTPPSWKVWKPKFIQKSQIKEYYTGDITKKDEPDSDYKQWEIKYYKRRKFWKIVPLKNKSELDSMNPPYNQYHTA